MTDASFRILDLGAHDGFVTNYIARRAKAAGHELHVDGIEANLTGVQLFNERAERDGISGHCKRGLAEDAYTLFKSRSYDAVVAFELIEHVPDVEAFLDVCETMCKPTGRVYLSTPNGTFGAGSNPHHLRCWTMIDLFDLIRRRGHVSNALPGPDGVSVIGYQPRPYMPRKNVAIYVGPGWETWSPNDIEHKGLGGSETAAVRLADALTDAGCLVTVYGETSSGANGQVVYRHHSSFDPTDRRDLCIVSRIPELLDRPINAESVLFWMHDTDSMERITPERMQQVKRVMVLSEWHQAHVAECYPFLADRLYKTRNGIMPNYFTKEPEGDPIPRYPHRAIYSSSPDRGLDFLLRIWPGVIERVPDAELQYCYASVYDAVATQQPHIAKFRSMIESLHAELPEKNVTNLGSQTQPELALRMRQSSLWLAPSWSTPANQRFFETFCIGAVEAAAAGCYRLMSDWGALSERNEGPGCCLPPGTNGAPDPAMWVDTIVAALESETELKPSDEALSMDWQEVAADFLTAATPFDDPLPPAAREAMISAFGAMGGASMGLPAVR